MHLSLIKQNFYIFNSLTNAITDIFSLKDIIINPINYITLRKNNAGIDKEEEKKLAGPLATKELPAKGFSRRNGKREECSRQKKIR